LEHKCCEVTSLTWTSSRPT